MLHQSWVTILFLSLLFVVLCNAVISSFSSAYYKKIPLGRLSHSQLRIKQGNATLEHRFNVFVLSLLFGITSLRVIILTFVFAIIANVVFLTIPYNL